MLKRSISATVAVVLACASLHTWAEDADKPQIRFSLEPQPLREALIEWSEQAGMSFVLPSGYAAALRMAPRVEGIYQPEEALQRLVVGSGLRIDAIDSNTYALRSANAARIEREALVGDNGDPSRPRIALAADNRPQSDGMPGRDGAESPPSRRTVSARTPSANAEEALAEVVVTGTHLRGTSVSSPLLQFDRSAIERTGYANTQELIRNLPQNFSGGSLGASPDGTLGAGFGAQRNNESASAVNLRGLGESSTLVLLDGRRMAPSAFGGIVDVSMIPLAAIERVDVLTDGASAVYGSDAVAGVVNFVLRKDYDGAETSLRYGKVSDGNASETIASQALGKNWDQGGVIASAYYSYASALPSADRSFTNAAPQPTDILPRSKKYTGILSAHQELLSNVEVFGTALVARSDIFRSTTQNAASSTVTDARNDSNNFHAGLTLSAFSDWQIEISGALSQQKLELEYPAVTPLPAGYVPGTLALANDAKVTSTELKADGTILQLPGGDLKIAVGAGQRKERFSSVVTYLSPGVGKRSVERDIDAVYAEAFIPLVGESNSLRGVRHLSISTAFRYDDYSDFGNTTNPKYGIRWSPIEDLDFRASWSTSFRAPSVPELLGQSSGLFIYNWLFTSPDGVPDSTPVFVLFGANPELNAEESKNWTLGFDYRLPFANGARVSLNYFSVHFKNRIITPPFDTGALQRADIYGSLITTLSSDSAAAAYVQSMTANGGTFIDLFGFGTSGVRYIYADQQQNAAVVKQDGFDLTADYTFEVRQNSFNTRLNAAFINKIETGLTSSSTPTDLVDTYGNPLRLRLRADVSWSRGSILVNGAANYSNAYRDTSSSSRGRIPSWTTVDLAVRYTPESFGSFLTGASFGLNASNLFDKSPPFVQGGLGMAGVHYDVGNADPRGRFISLELRKAW